MKVVTGHKEKDFLNPLTNEELEDSGVLFQGYSGQFCKQLGTRNRNK